jgi:hypothetical protein
VARWPPSSSIIRRCSTQQKAAQEGPSRCWRWNLKPSKRLALRCRHNFYPAVVDSARSRRPRSRGLSSSAFISARQKRRADKGPPPSAWEDAGLPLTGGDAPPKASPWKWRNSRGQSSKACIQTEVPSLLWRHEIWLISGTPTAKITGYIKIHAEMTWHRGEWNNREQYTAVQASTNHEWPAAQEWIQMPAIRLKNSFETNRTATSRSI